ncbi:hypothetical protein NDU88_000797 [Pleurodeles waltl]|uniref:Uncharacterized protein n=1 Tax=Pleurodeles waltl TaxID=8319 RepID=A0AAV7U4H7_PLEWA|nr:hypothetical protein NDU88_000795 [Pleurodeles waltl]KAJ1183987.1 hypothetical protein NDU88_000797 [Pleurodeles waltl]
MVGHPPSLHPAAQGGRGEAPVPCGTWRGGRKAAPPVRRPRGVTARHPVRLPLLGVSLHDSKNVSRRSARELPPPPRGRGVRFPGRLGARAAPPPPVPPGGPGGAARVFETLGPVDGVPGNEGGVSAPPARRPSARRGRESPVPRRAAPSRASRPGLAHPPALVGRSRGSLAGPGSSSPRPPCRPGTAGLSGVVQAQGGTTIRFTLPGSCRVGVGSVSGGA